MSKLNQLREKRRRRVARRRKHYAKWVRFKKANRKIRRNYQLRQFNRQVKAIRKLDRLIKQELERLARVRINWNGCPRLEFKPLLKAVRFALHSADGLYITATTNGTHAPGSWHYQKRAVDFGSSGPGESPEIEAQNALLNAFGADYFEELFGPDQFFIKNGVIYPGVFPGHGDHLHVAVA